MSTIETSSTPRREDQSVVDYLVRGYRRHREFQPTPEVSRRELAEAFAENARRRAESYTEIKECLRDVCPWTETPDTVALRGYMKEYKAKREAWAKAIDLLWRFSDDDGRVDADALREALTRESLREHKLGTRRARDREGVHVKAAGIARETADLDRMSEERRDKVREYR